MFSFLRIYSGNPETELLGLLNSLINFASSSISATFSEPSFAFTKLTISAFVKSAHSVKFSKLLVSNMTSPLIE